MSKFQTVFYFMETTLSVKQMKEDATSDVSALLPGTSVEPQAMLLHQS